MPGAEVEIANGLEAMGKLYSAVVRDGSQVTFRWMPWLFDIQYWLITKFAPTRWLFHHLGYWLGARGLLRLIAEHDPDVVISTYPGVTAVLGMLRENRRLGDPGAVGDHRPRRPALLGPPRRRPALRHPPGVDRGSREAGRAGQRRVDAAADLTRVPDAAHPHATPARRSTFPLTRASCSSPAAAGGSATSRARSQSALSDDDTLVVCITGRNEVAREKLEQRFGDNEQVRVLGFTEQMSDWMAAADAMIHATAGLTVLEAHIRGCPVVSYGFSAGHLRANNAAFERFGLAEVARSEHELESVLRHVTRERRSPDSSFASLPSIASRALTVRPAGRPQPVWRLRFERVAAAVTLAAVAVILMLSIVKRESPLKPRSRSRAASTSARTAIRPTLNRRPSRRSAGAGARQPGSRGELGSLIGPSPRGGADRGCVGSRRPGAGAGGAGPIGEALGIKLREEGGDGVALTFDDGPHPQGTPAVLEHLREAGDAKATFFLAGEQVVQRPALVAEIVAAGHRVELHCHRHRNQLRLTPRALLEDAERAKAAIEEAGGQEVRDYRPPYGIFSAAGLRAVRRRGWRPVLWSRWGRDWDETRDARLDRASGDGRRRGRRHPASARRRLLQRARLLGAHRRGAADDPRGARRAGTEVEAAAPLSRRRERPDVAAGERFVEALRHRAPGPVLVEDLLVP